MRNKLSILFLCFCFGFAMSKRSELSDDIIAYFRSKNIFVLHVFVCNEIDSLHLRKTVEFSIFLSVIFYKRLINWNSVMKTNSGWFIDTSCYYNRNILRQVKNYYSESFSLRDLFQNLQIVFYFFVIFAFINLKVYKYICHRKIIPYSMLGEGFTWLLRGELDEVLISLKKMNVGFSSDIVVAEHNGTLYDIYKLTSRSELQVKLLEASRFLSKRIRYNLEQNTLRGSFVFTTFKINNETSHLILDKYYYPQDEKINRMYYAFFMYLSKLFNFTLDILVSETYGYRSKNGTFNGEIRDLILTKADFGMSAIGITNERLNSVDFTANIDDVYFLVIFIEEKAFGGYKALIQPFSSNVWIGLSIIIVAATVVSSVPKSLNTFHTALADGSMLIVSVMCSQGLSKDFPGSYKKGLSIVLLFFSMIVTIFYHTSIMNGLLSPTPNLIKTVEDVVAKKKIGVANISYLTPLFLHPLVVQKLNEVNEKRYEIPVGIKKVQQDKMFSLIGDEKTLREAMERSFTDSEKCNGREIRAGSKIQIATPIKKYSHYKEMIIFGQVILIERGIVHREKKHWYTDAPKCLVDTSFIPVSIESTFIGLGIFLIGISTSIIIFILEMIIKKEFITSVKQNSNVQENKFNIPLHYGDNGDQYQSF